MGLLINTFELLNATSAITGALFHYLNNAKNITSPHLRFENREGIVILGGGRSQSLFWENAADFCEYDILCVNSVPMMNEELFFKHKPRFYCCIEPSVFDFSLPFSVEFRKRVEEVLNRVDWNLFVITYEDQEFTLDNPNIGTIKISKYRYDGNIRCVKHFLWKRNLASPYAITVPIIGLFFSVVFKYKNIALFGLDFDYFTTYYVNSDGFVCDKQIHASEDEKDAREDVFEDFYDELLNVIHSYEGFKDIRIFGDFTGVRIVNYNLYSFIDAFEKSNKYVK